MFSEISRVRAIVNFTGPSHYRLADPVMYVLPTKSIVANYQ
jgi:hypothetical protein